MVDKLEQKFFEAFGIEPTEEKYCYWECKIPALKDIACTATECGHYKHKINYPSISPKIVLGLIKILTNKIGNMKFTSMSQSYRYSYCTHKGVYEGNPCYSLEECVLSLCTHLKDEIQEQVKELFNGQEIN